MLTSPDMTWLLAAVAKGDAAPSSAFMPRPAPSSTASCCASCGGTTSPPTSCEDTYLQIWRTAGEFDPTLAQPARLDGGDRAPPRHRPGAPARHRGRATPSPRSRSAKAPARCRAARLTEELKRLLTCIGRLEPDRQRMLLLAYYGAFSREQLAVKLDMPGQPPQGLAAAQPVRDRAMPDIVRRRRPGALAAEYVLGTLDADERTRANVLLDVDHSFRGMVRIWERRLGELHLMVEPVEPDAADLGAHQGQAQGSRQARLLDGPRPAGKPAPLAPISGA